MLKQKFAAITYCCKAIRAIEVTALLLLGAGVQAWTSKPVQAAVMHSIPWENTLTSIAPGTTPETALRDLFSPRPASLPAIAPSPQLRNGTYLYGEAPKPNQLGATYMVFEVKQSQVLGAVYSPHSSFDCFHGTMRDGQIALRVLDSYSRQPYHHAIALTQDAVVASNGLPSGAIEIGLENMFKLPMVSANDQQLLKTCKSLL